MNIGIVTTWFERGAAYVSKAYADILDRRHNVFIYARGGEKYAKEDDKWNAPNVTWGHRYKTLGTRIRWIHFKKWLETNSIDTVIFNEQNDWEVIVNCRKLDLKILSYVDYYKQDTVDLFTLYDALICNTKRHYEVFQYHRNCIYIPWGTDIRLFSPRQNDHDTITFFHSAGMGGANGRKGTDSVVRAFNRLKVPARLIVHSQAGIEKYANVAEIIQKNSSIEFINETVTAPGLYYMGDVYVYPTKLEGIGLTVAEALSCGLPVIATNNQPMNEFIVDGLNGSLVDVKRYVSRADGYYWPESECCEESLYAAMIRMCTEYTNNKLLDMKVNARVYAEEHLNWETNSSSLCEFIENIEEDKDKQSNLKKIRYKALAMSYADRKTWCDDFIYYARRIGRKLSSLD